MRRAGIGRKAPLTEAVAAYLRLKSVICQTEKAILHFVQDQKSTGRVTLKRNMSIY